MDFGVLGHISAVHDDGDPVPLPSTSLRRLLALLVLRANTVTSVGQIGLHVGLTDGAVRTGMVRLRRRLGAGSGLLTESPGYVLRSDRIDHVRFEAAASAASGAVGGGADVLERALAMWRGDAYEEFAHEEWAAAEAARLDELRATTTELLVELLLADGRHEAALPRVAVLIERHPYRDRPAAQRMRALAAMGRLTESLRSFQDYRTQLLAEVGTLPSAALVELDALIAAGGAPEGVVSSGPLASGERLEGRGVLLPRSRTFGLDELADQVASELREGELVTLTGVGGIGKTRLAMTAAGRVAPDFERIVLADLRPSSSAEIVLAVVARALGVETGSPTGLIDTLQRRRMLLVFDNCEHVLGPAGELIATILDAAPWSCVLATSRQPLALGGERIHRVPAMTLEDATALFVDRASRWRATLAKDDPSSQRQIADICARLERIPLAVELAAGCVAHMTLSEIAAQLADRLTFLPGDPTRSHQQRTLRATMDWSYGLLDDEARSLLGAPSVFTADFDAAAAAAVWQRPLAATLAQLGRLVHASLVAASAAGDVMRYELLELVRLYAEEHATAGGLIDSLCAAHADHYAAVLDATDTLTLLRPTHAARADISHHDRMLEWVEQAGDLRRLGVLAWRTAMFHRAECWTDPTGRYLGRLDVAAALTGHERACYYTASFENANVLGRYSEQLECAELGLETASGPVRLALLRGAASACSLLAPARVEGLIDEAIALADPADLDTILELRRTRVDGVLLSGQLDAAADALRAVWADVVEAQLQHTRRPLAAIDLLWVQAIVGDDDEVATLADALCDLPGGAVAGHCGHAIVDARRHLVAPSAERLLTAAKLAATEAVPLIDNDVKIVAALRAVELDQAERACRILAALTGGGRSPGSAQLLVHTRRIVGRRLDADTVSRLRSEAHRDGPAGVFAAELRTLEDEACGQHDDDPHATVMTD